MLLKLKKIIFNIIYVLIIIYLLIFIPSLWGQKPLVVISGSMEPTLNVGGLLYYHELPMKEYQKEDILVFESKNHTISHRIVEINDEGFITKGDANKSIDSSFVLKEQVLGKATNWCIPFLGLYADFLSTHKYLIFITIGILIIDLCFDYYKIRKKEQVF